MADREAFDAYVRHRWDPLLRTAALLTGDAAAAEDLVQESLVRAARHWHRVDPGAVDAYVRRVMYTRSIDAWRWRRRQPDPVDPVRYDGPVPTTPTLATRLTLVDALSRLTPRQRAVLVARFYEDRTEVDAARVLGCSVSTVKSQTRHALERLRVLAPSSPRRSAVRRPRDDPTTEELTRLLNVAADDLVERDRVPDPMPRCCGGGAAGSPGPAGPRRPGSWRSSCCSWRPAGCSPASPPPRLRKAARSPIRRSSRT